MRVSEIVIARRMTITKTRIIKILPKKRRIRFIFVVPNPGAPKRGNGLLLQSRKTRPVRFDQNFAMETDRSQGVHFIKTPG